MAGVVIISQHYDQQKSLLIISKLKPTEHKPHKTPPGRPPRRGKALLINVPNSALVAVRALDDRTRSSSIIFSL
jgi:hypothetical protein